MIWLANLLELKLHVAFYGRVEQALLQSRWSFFVIESGTSGITKRDEWYYKVGRVVLQSGTSDITKRDEWYYKVGRVVLQSGEIITK